jgi:cyclopropane fatty-acyl-phospholipid synthase-like methyltransferase
MRAAMQAELLHRGGTAGTWGNLGLWSGPDGGYAQACIALADAVAGAAGLAAGERVLSVACGGGDELLHWVRHHGAAQVQGIDSDARAVAAAQRLVAGAGLADRIAVHQRTGTAPQAGPAAAFDRVLCVDAAYHLCPRSGFLRAALRALRPGGRLAFTDLVVEDDAAGLAQRTLLRTCALACGVGFDELRSTQAGCERLRDAGFTDVRVQRLDDAVLGGFARFVAQQQRRLGRDAWRAAWLRPAITARLIAPARAAGLGYALFSATAPSIAAATA